MPVIPVSSALRLVLTGAPSLYRAARAVGAGRTEALSVVADSAIVWWGAARHSPTRWRQQNAVRHFTWQAWLTARHGLAVSRAVAAAQERGREGVADSEVDVRNNAAGQAYGLAHAEHLTAQGRRTALSELLAVATQLFGSDDLAAQPRRRRRR